jgi:predicted nucleic acid-binding protein
MKIDKRVFIDTNIWIYAFLEVKEKNDKQVRILSFLEEEKRDSEITTSIQCINEFHWILQIIR